MNFSEFAKMLRPKIGRGRKIPEFVLFLTDKIINEPKGDEETSSIKDSYNPLAKKGNSLLYKIYNGVRDISESDAQVLSSYLNIDRFKGFLSEFPNEVIDMLNSDMKKKGFNIPEEETIDVCADCFKEILDNCAKGKTKTKTASSKKVTSTWDKEKERHIDSMEYDFILDEEALGRWKVYDFVNTIDSFNPSQKNWPEELHYYSNTFNSDGTMTIDSQYNPGTYKWTKGYMFWDSWEVIPAYEIRHIGLNTYMFVQWKSGDYYIRRSAPSYYVFIKDGEYGTNVASN